MLWEVTKKVGLYKKVREIVLRNTVKDLRLLN